MIQNIEALRKAYTDGEQFDFLLFWGHTPSKDGTIQSTYLSQWWPCTFSEDKTIYSSTEQYMMAGKAKLFDDIEIHEQILQAYEPKTIKALGRKVQHFDDQIWKQHRFDIVVQGNLLKFSQNKELLDFLLSTGKSIWWKPVLSIGFGASAWEKTTNLHRIQPNGEVATCWASR